MGLSPLGVLGSQAPGVRGDGARNSSLSKREFLLGGVVDLLALLLRLLIDGVLNALRLIQRLALLLENLRRLGLGFGARVASRQAEHNASSEHSAKRCAGQNHGSSMATAVASPPPINSAAIPRFRLRACNAWISVTIDRK